MCAKLPRPLFSSPTSFYFGPTLASLPLLLIVFSPSPFFTPPSSSSFFHSPRPPDFGLGILFFAHENYCDLVIFWVMQPRPRIRFPAAGRRFTHNLRTKCLGARETNALSLQVPLGKNRYHCIHLWHQGNHAISANSGFLIRPMCGWLHGSRISAF